MAVADTVKTGNKKAVDKLQSGENIVAMESADIVLMRSDLMDVPTAIHLSKKTIRNIKENLFWAFAMSFSSVSVLMNALRLRKFSALK